MCWCSVGYPHPVCFVWVTGMTLYRIKPGFDPATASQPSWNPEGRMDYLLTSVFEAQKEGPPREYLMTVDRYGNFWYLNSDWVVPAVTEIDLTVLGDEI